MTDHRTYIQVFRDASEIHLQANIQQTEDIVQNEPRMYAAEREFMVFFDDATSVMLDMTNYQNNRDIFDVYVNGGLTKTCMFHGQKTRDGVLVHIFKEKEDVRVAESSDSTCIPAKARNVEEKQKKKFHPSPLK